MAAGGLKPAADGCSTVNKSFGLGVEYEHKSTASSSEDVGESSLEESTTTFVKIDSLEAVHSALVHFLLTAGVHHESTTDGIKRVGSDASTDSDDLSEGPHGEDVGLLGIGEENGLTGVEHTEIGGAISDNTDDRDTETSVETLRAVLLSDLHEAVDETTELTVTTGADIGGKTGTSEIERVDDTEGCSTGSTTRGAVTEEEFDGLGLGVVRVEPLLVQILEGEVEGLSGEVPDDVGQVTSPEGSDTLLLDDSLEAVTNTVVSILRFDSGRGILYLEEELDSLDGSDNRLGDGSGYTAHHKVNNERLLLRTFRHRIRLCLGSLIDLYFNYKQT